MKDFIGQRVFPNPDVLPGKRSLNVMLMLDQDATAVLVFMFRIDDDQRIVSRSTQRVRRVGCVGGARKRSSAHAAAIVIGLILVICLQWAACEIGCELSADLLYAIFNSDTAIVEFIVL